MHPCDRCSSPALKGRNLCSPCEIELELTVANAEPDPLSLRCAVCGQSYRLIESRVLRFAKNPLRGDQVTPHLCWVCTRLYYSARSRQELVVPSF